MTVSAVQRRSFPVATRSPSVLAIVFDYMPDNPPGRPAILVIDDHHAIREVIRRALTAAGYDVLEWADPEAAVDYLARTDDTIALALVDGVMPQMLGPHVSAEIQRLRPGVPILLMSGHEAPMFSEIFDRPDHHYIAKPFVIRDLVARITRIIGQSE